MAGFVSEERLTFGPWAAFERTVARLVQHSGFSDVNLVGGTGDHGADVVAVGSGQRWVLQAKYRGSGGVDASGAAEAIHASSQYGAGISVLVANTYFYQDAYRFQSDKRQHGFDLKLWDGAFLLKYYDQLPSASIARRELREYQVKAIDAVELKRGQGARNALVIMATGLGKTVVATQLIANEVRRNPGQEILVLAHVTDLVRQLEIAAWPQLDKSCSTHLWTDGELPAYRGGVIFATWQSVFAAMERGDEDLKSRFGLVIVDEAHHAPSAAFARLLDH
ncbi:MAG: DEAD/DEAH box helicase, partial [Oxalobacteraceae bacterium]